MDKGSIAADFIRLFKNDSRRYRNQAGTKMSDGTFGFTKESNAMVTANTQGKTD